MIKVDEIREIVEQKIIGSDKFIVDINVSDDNKISVIIDSDNSGISINDCVLISRAIEDEINRDDEDFELQVESAGLDRPLKMLRQYQKNINNDIDIVFTNGKKLSAKLTAAAAESIDIEYQEKVLLENKKRKQTVTKNETIRLADVKSAKIVVSFR
ncbi:MAG: ribosome assembly cofactor RimP [Prevotellaceae bacterium]|jgi:ribosome maturation factor RimP|nr:ribosome assembly cofactor RimP [Prevotellaceae bacterium]